MISPDDLRQYHRQATIYVLQSNGGMTAAEIHEAVTATALTCGHPKECGSITPAGIAGVLRTLQNECLAVPRGGRRNTRHGRSEPTWALAEGIETVAQPSAPSRRPPVSPSSGPYDPMAGLSREQLMAMLLVSDELSEATARFQAEVDVIRDRARRVLAGGSVT